MISAQTESNHLSKNQNQNDFSKKHKIKIILKKQNQNQNQNQKLNQNQLILLQPCFTKYILIAGSYSFGTRGVEVPQNGNHDLAIRDPERVLFYLFVSIVV